MQRLIFAGTSEFGIPTLEALKKQYELVLIITQPDKPAGRTRKLTAPPIKVWAEKNGIRVEQPTRIAELKSQLESLEPDLMIVAAYGQIIPLEILNIPKFKSINIHGSILPKYRGASPIQATILNGDPSAGITLIQMDEKMDHGPVLGIRTIALDGKETFPVLYEKLSHVASELMVDVLPNWFAATLTPQVQNHAEATFCKLLDRKDGRINWARPAVEIDRQIRALNPEPGTWTMLSDKVVKILEAEIIADHKIDLPGKLYVAQDGLAVKCLDNSLLIKKVKPEGKNEMTGKDYVNGLQNLSGKLFM